MDGNFNIGWIVLRDYGKQTLILNQLNMSSPTQGFTYNFSADGVLHMLYNNAENTFTMQDGKLINKTDISQRNYTVFEHELSLNGEFKTPTYRQGDFLKASTPINSDIEQRMIVLKKNAISYTNNQSIYLFESHKGFKINYVSSK